MKKFDSGGADFKIDFIVILSCRGKRGKGFHKWPYTEQMIVEAVY